MSHRKANILTYKAGAAISRGQAVKFGADKEHVVKSAGNTDMNIGIAQNDAASAEDLVEVAGIGGGGVALAKEQISMGKLLVANADGSLEQTNADGDRLVAMAMEDAVAGDLFGVDIVMGLATKADA